MDGFQLAVVGLAAVAGGAVNALAGGGTLITFPVLMAVGIPAVAANVTNTVALCPGYLGATFAQMKDLRGQERRLWLLLPVAALGGILGGFLLLHTGNHLFRKLVPYLIVFAAVLLALQDWIRAWVVQRGGSGSYDKWVALPVLPAAMYGGYFGAGLSVIVLAVLGISLDDSLTRLNALKQALSFSVNIAAALFLLFSGQVVWSATLVMAVGALAGGVLGGRLAGRVSPLMLRRTVVGIASIVACVYFVK
jgi:uncharacterized membrane protein YfcA